jgi:hypothetical protein
MAKYALLIIALLNVEMTLVLLLRNVQGVKYACPILQIVLRNALRDLVITMETLTIMGNLFLVMMDVINVLAQMEMLFVRREPAQILVILANMKVTHTRKEIPSLVKMDVILVLVLLERSIVLKNHV